MFEFSAECLFLEAEKQNPQIFALLECMPICCIWNGVFGFWNGVFGIQDGVYFILDRVFWDGVFDIMIG